MTQNPGNFIEQETLKGGEFIIKDSQKEGMFIPEELNEEQEMVRQMCQDSGELGLLSSHIPEEFDGMPMDTHTNTVILEEMGKSGGGFTTTYAAHTGIGTLPILYFGTEAQKKKYLPGLGSGELKASYCLTEPSSGSDALAAKTRADLSEDGKSYILNGQKMWITNAGFADVFIVFAQVDGDKFTGFIVERGTEGLTFGAEEEKLGIKGSSTRQVFLENVTIPVDNLLGELGKGHLIAFNILNVGRYKLGAMCLGGNKKAIKSGVNYANERIQFKVPISSFGAIQYKIGEQAIRNFVLESSIYRTSELMHAKKTQLLEGGASYVEALLEAADEYAIECAIMKVYGSEVTDYVVDECVQIHGGNGFSRLLKNAMKGKLDIVGPAWAVQKELTSMPSMTPLEGAYAEEAKAVKDFKKVVLMVAGAAAKMQMDGKIDLRKEQEILMNVADMMIDVFNAESTLLRVEKLADMENKKQSQDVYDAILKTFITDATARMNKNATDALTGFAEGDLLKTMLLGLKRFTKYQPINVKAARRLVASKLIEANDYSL